MINLGRIFGSNEKIVLFYKIFIMKKSLFVSLILLSGVLLTACGDKETWTKSTDLINPVVTEECKSAVENYLVGADKEWQWEEVKAWDNIVVDYIWRLEDGTVFDTSIQSIAEVCGVYSEWRDYTEWLSFQAQGGQMVKWFDNGVIWMKIWQTKTVQFWPEEWYGDYDKTKVEVYTTEEVWDLTQYEPWMMMQKNYYEIGVITSVTDKEMVVDYNHKLAGKNLIFDITLKSIN